VAALQRVDALIMGGNDVMCDAVDGWRQRVEEWCQSLHPVRRSEILEMVIYVQ
jgi:hypothetical protein